MYYENQTRGNQMRSQLTNKLTQDNSNNILDQLSNELQIFIDKWNSQQDVIKQFSGRQKFEWLSENENYLSNISRQLDQASVGGNQISLQQCENLLLEAQKMLRRFTVQSAQVHQQALSPQIQRIEEIKRKEEQLDNEFIQLLERYNNSKGQIENLSRKDLQNQEQNNQNFLSNSSKKNIDRLKQTITYKDTKVKDKLQVKEQINQELQEAFNKQVIRSQNLEDALRIKDEILQKYDQEIKICQNDLFQNCERLNDYKKKYEEQRQKLNEFELLEIQYKEKLENKSNKLKELKIQYNETNIILEDLKGIHNIETKKMQEQIDNLLQNIDEKQNKIAEYEISDKKLREEIQSHSSNVLNLKDQFSLSQQNHINVQQQLEIQQEKIKILMNQIKQLDEEKDMNRDIKLTLEQKIIKNRQNFEEEKKKIQNEFNQKLQLKKNKKKVLKQNLQQLSEQNNKQERQILQLTQQLEILQKKFDDSERNNQDIKHELRQKTLELKQYQDSHSLNNLQKEKSEQIITNFEEKIKYLQTQDDKKQQQINDHIRQQDSILEENKNLQQKIIKSEQQLDHLEKCYSQEIQHIESKIDALIGESKILKDENSQLKQKELNTKNQLNELQENYNNLKQKYLKQKNTNKELKEHLDELERKMKEYIIEKTIEQREQEKYIDLKKISTPQTKNKLKVLDDIQVMIQSHKKMVASNSSKSIKIE